MIQKVLSFGMILLTFCNSGNLTKENAVLKKETEPQRLYSEKNIADNSEFISDNWEVEVKSISDGDLTDAVFVGELYGWVMKLKGRVIGDFDSYKIEKSDLLKTTDGGNSWKRVELSLPENSFIRRIYLLNESRGWLITQGDRVDPDKTPFWLLETTDGGDNWKIIYTFVASGISKMIFTEEGKGWIVGSVRPNNSLVKGMALYTEDFGKSWVNVYSDKFPTTRFREKQTKDMRSPVKDIHLNSNGNPFLVLQNGTIFKMIFNMGKWEQILIKETEEFGNNHLVNKGKDEYLLLSPKKPGNGSVSLKSLWIKDRAILGDETLKNFYLEDVIPISENELLACGHNSIFESMFDLNNPVSKLGQSPAIIYSHDNGQTWKPIYETLGVVQYLYDQGRNKNPIKKMEYGKYFQNYQNQNIESASFHKITTDGKGKYFIVGDNGLFLTLERLNK